MPAYFRVAVLAFAALFLAAPFFAVLFAGFLQPSIAIRRLRLRPRPLWAEKAMPA